ncbi:lipase family protein [Rhodotorula paludigena]|uniref:lipase family protein n=1 Tax=Rhodotorula paludigena TaxID=86838 RepID=UPI003178467E
MDDERSSAPPSSASAARQLSQPEHFAWFPSSPDRAAAPPRPGPSPPSVKPADALDDELASLALPASTLSGAAEDDGTPRALARASAPFAVSSVPTATPRPFASIAQSSTTDAGFDLLAKQEASSPARTADASAAEPPSPLALPGSWRGGGRTAPFATQRTRPNPSSTDDGEAGLRWRLVPRRREENREDEDGGEEDEALLLPPPFLDDDSPRETFDGLLGARTARRKTRLQRQHERLYAQGRAPPPPFPHNVVKAATKVLRLLGPPGGYNARPRAPEAHEQIVLSAGESADEGHSGGHKSRRRPKKRGMSFNEAAKLVEDAVRGGATGGEPEQGRHEERQRRRVRRAESGMRAYDLGIEVGKKVAGRLERHRSRRGGAAVEFGAPWTPAPPSWRQPSFECDKDDALVAATPSQLLGTPPTPAVRLSPVPPLAPLDDEVDDFSPLPPSAPSLRPLAAPELPPLPTVGTPLSLEPAALDGYFGLRQRSTARRLSKHSRSPKSAVSDPLEPATPRTPFTIKPFPTPLSNTRTTLLDSLIWVLIGSARSPSSADLDTTVASLGGLVGLVVHSIGFVFFVGFHLATLFIASYAGVRATTIFVYWAWMNLTGRTEVAKAVVEYWRTCRVEWDKVCLCEGEPELSAWSVVKGVAELAALQSMTHARWLEEGPGALVLLNGDVEEDRGLATPRFGPARRRHSARFDRPSITQRQESFSWASGGGEEDGEGLVVTSQDDGVLQGSIISRDYTSRLPDGRRAIKPLEGQPTTIDQLLEEEPPPLNLDAALAGGPSQLPSSPPLQPIREQIDPLAELVATIKRCCRLSTASYGLHTMIASPPTPLLTPSGQTLPHRLFAHLGGVDDHRNVLHVALQKRYTGLPAAEEEAADEVYAPQLYLLRDDARAEIVVVFRGTQSLADLRTDLEGSFIPLDLPAVPAAGPPSFSSSQYRIHSGILSTARHLLSSASSSSLFSKLQSILAAHPRYSLVLTGHSLGAALASTVALLLGEYDETDQAWYIRADAGLSGSGTSSVPLNEATGASAPEQQHRRALRAVCFAHPTTVNAPLAARCAFPPPLTSASSTSASNGDVERHPLVLSVSLGSDVICRMGVPHVREIRRAVGRLDAMRRRVRDETTPTEGILTKWRAWRKAVKRAGDGDEGDEAAAQLRARLEDEAWVLRGEAEGWTCASDGKEDDVATAIPAGRTFHLDRLPVALEQRRRDELAREVGQEEADEAALWGLFEVKDPRRFFCLPLLQTDLIQAHMPKTYLDGCEAL